MALQEDSRDQVLAAIGNIGRWQWMIILPLAIREIFTSWQMLSPPFLAMKPTDYFCSENGTEKFVSLPNWREFANPVLEDGSVDKCHVYDLDYNQDFEDVLNGSELTNTIRACVSWTFYDNETSTLITDVSILVLSPHLLLRLTIHIFFLVSTTV